MLPLTTSQPSFWNYLSLLGFHCTGGDKGALKCCWLLADLIKPHPLYHCHLSNQDLPNVFLKISKDGGSRILQHLIFFTVRNNFIVYNMNFSHWSFITLPPVCSKFVPSEQQSSKCSDCSHVPSKSFLIEAEQNPISSLPDCFPDFSHQSPWEFYHKCSICFLKSGTQCSTLAEVWAVPCKMERWSCQCCRLHFYLFTSIWCFSVLQ